MTLNPWKWDWKRIAAALRYAWPLRVPLLSGALLMTLPLIAFGTRLRPYLTGLFDPVTPYAMVLITMLAILIGGTNLIIWCMVVSYGHARMDLPPRDAAMLPGTRAWVFAVLSAAPVVVVTIRYASQSPVMGMGELAFWALVGAVLAGGLLWLAYFISGTVGPVASRRARQPGTVGATQFNRFLEFLERHPSIGAGFIIVKKDHAGKIIDLKIAPGHGLALGLSIASVIAYAGVAYSTRNVHRPLIASALAYVLLLQLMLTWLAGFAAFMLDRARAPLAAYLLGWILVVNVAIHPFCSTDHAYLTYEIPAAPGRLEPPALVGDTEAPIVIAASGGGIQSAAWTALVVSQLDRVPGFRERLRLISAVSGGSAGSMNMLASWDQCGPERTVEEKAALVTQPFDPLGAAGESSLHAVGWGLVFKDLPRTFLPFFLSPFVDRGSVLEDAWKREPRLQRVTREGPLLASWRRNVAERECPALIFNAMAAETGEPMLFSTAGLPRSLKAFDFYERYQDRDLPLTTAVRLSAAFPFVTPASRADRDDLSGHFTHVVDGGYFDNYGISTLIGVVHDGLARARAPRKAKRLLIVEICDSVDCSGKETNGDLSKGGDDQSWTYQLTAPLSAMMAMRQAAQRVNNRASLRLLKDFWLGEEVCVESLQVPYGGGNAPMSWHLTAKEKEDIDAAWQARGPAVLTAVSAFVQGKRATQEGARCDGPLVAHSRVASSR